MRQEEVNVESECGRRVKTERERDMQKERCVRCEWRVCAGTEIED